MVWSNLCICNSFLSLFFSLLFVCVLFPSSTIAWIHPHCAKNRKLEPFSLIHLDVFSSENSWNGHIRVCHTIVMRNHFCNYQLQHAIHVFFTDEKKISLIWLSNTKRCTFSNEWTILRRFVSAAMNHRFNRISILHYSKIDFNLNKCFQFVA